MVSFVHKVKFESRKVPVLSLFNIIIFSFVNLKIFDIFSWIGILLKSKGHLKDKKEIILIYL